MNTLAYVAINGLASAVGIITGKTIGAGKTALMKEYARTTQVIFLALGFVIGGLVFLCSAPFVSLYQGISAEGRPGGESLRFVRVLSVTLIGTCYQMPCLFGLVKSAATSALCSKTTPSSSSWWCCPAPSSPPGWARRRGWCSPV